MQEFGRNNARYNSFKQYHLVSNPVPYSVGRRAAEEQPHGQLQRAKHGGRQFLAVSEYLVRVFCLVRPSLRWLCCGAIWGTLRAAVRRSRPEGRDVDCPPPAGCTAMAPQSEST